MRYQARDNENMLRPNHQRRVEVIDDDLADVLRTKSPAEKIQMVGAANRTARILAAAGVRFLHPDWDENQVEAEVLRRIRGSHPAN